MLNKYAALFMIFSLGISCSHSDKAKPFIYSIVVNDNAPTTARIRKSVKSSRKKTGRKYRKKEKSLRSIPHKIKVFENIRRETIDITRNNLKKYSANTRDPKNGDTLLIYAVKINRIDQAKLLLKRGAKVNLRNNNGETAMDIALRDNRVIISKLLKRYVK